MLSGFLFVGEGLLAENLAAQTAQPVAGRENASSVDQEIAMLRSDLRSNRKQLVAANIEVDRCRGGKVLADLRPIRYRTGSDQRRQIATRSNDDRSAARKLASAY
jgi:hypothetical protein